jgi:hypothetical protein
LEKPSPSGGFFTKEKPREARSVCPCETSEISVDLGDFSRFCRFAIGDGNRSTDRPRRLAKQANFTGWSNRDEFAEIAHGGRDGKVSAMRTAGLRAAGLPAHCFQE